MIELIVIAALSFGGGWYVGHENPTVSCLDQPLIEATCTDIQPPSDDSFGATTSAYVSLVGKYRACQTAAKAAVK